MTVGQPLGLGSGDGVEKEEDQVEILRGLQTAEQCNNKGLVSITQDQ